MKIITYLRNGVEELELVAPVDLLRRAGLTVTLASCESMLAVTGRNGMTLISDTLLEDVRLEDYDCHFIPGGPQTVAMRQDERVLKALQKADSSGKLIAAICAAPLVLLDAQLLGGRRYTAHHSAAGELPELDASAVVLVDGNLITSQGAGTAVPFALELVKRLCGEEKATEIAKSICCEGWG